MTSGHRYTKGGSLLLAAAATSLAVIRLMDSAAHTEFEGAANRVGWFEMAVSGCLLLGASVLEGRAQRLADAAMVSLAACGSALLALAVVPPESTAALFVLALLIGAVAVLVLFGIHLRELRKRRQDEERQAVVDQEVTLARLQQPRVKSEVEELTTRAAALEASVQDLGRKLDELAVRFEHRAPKRWPGKWRLMHLRGRPDWLRQRGPDA